MNSMIHSFQTKYFVLAILAFFFFASPGTSAMAAEDSAGKILRMEGSVQIIRYGKTIVGTTNTKIYPTDEIITGPESLVELMFRDGSSLHLGSDSKLELKQYKFSIVDDNPSFIAKMTKGLFVYISGAISKVHPGSVKFETPDATIGIRGTKIVVSVTETTMVINFMDPTGKIGVVTISNTNGTQTLDQEYHSIVVSWETAPSSQEKMDLESIKQLIQDNLQNIVFENNDQGLPYTDIDAFLEDLQKLFTDSDDIQFESLSAPSK